MRPNIIIFVSVLFIGIIHTAYSQTTTNKEAAAIIAEKAIKLMDSGKVDESIKLLKESQKLDPSHMDLSL